MIDRINLILKTKNLTAKQFAEEIGVQPSGMSHILSGRNNPSLDFVMKVMKRYPEIDINWLMNGKGEMYIINGTYTPAAPADEARQPVREEQAPLHSTPRAGTTHAVRAEDGLRTGQGTASVSRQSFRKEEGRAGEGLTLFDYLDDAESNASTLPAGDSPSRQGGSAASVTGPRTEAMAARSVYATGTDSRTGQSAAVEAGAGHAAEADGVHSLREPRVNKERKGTAADAGDKKVPQEYARATPLAAAFPASEGACAPSVTNGDSGAGMQGACPCPAVCSQHGRSARKIVKMVVMYDDHTFAEYFPE